MKEQASEAPSVPLEGRPGGGGGLDHTLVAIVTATAAVECMAEGSSCPIVASCGLISPLAKARAAFLAVLDPSTLADAASQSGALREALARGA